MSRDEDKTIVDLGKDTAVQLSTAGVISGLIGLMSGDPNIDVLLNIGIPLIGASAAIKGQSNSRAQQQVEELERQKLKLAIEAIQQKMEKHQVKELTHLLMADIHVKRYQFIRTIMREAIDAKSDLVREYCASMVVWAGVKDFSEEDIEYRRLYRTLDILKQLDDLDFHLLIIYDLQMQMYVNRGDSELKKKRDAAILNLSANEQISTQEIKLSINKLASLGLFDGETTLASYEDPHKKLEMINQVSVVNTMDHRTPVYDFFNQYVFTFF